MNARHETVVSCPCKELLSFLEFEANFVQILTELIFFGILACNFLFLVYLVYYLVV